MRLPRSRSLYVAAALLASTAMGAGVTFYVSGTFNFPASGGSISPYQVGFYDLEEGEAEVFLVNPTPYPLLAFVVQYDDDAQPVDCARVYLAPNDFGEFELENSPAEEGVIKVVSVKPPVYGQALAVQSGVVAWIRHQVTGADTELKSLPASLLTANSNYELHRIYDYVTYNCGN